MGALTDPDDVEQEGRGRGGRGHGREGRSGHDRGGRGDRGSRGERGGAGRQRLPRRRLHVLSTEHVTENLLRIVAGGDLSDWEVTDAGGHFKLFVPWGEGETATRTYTVRAFDRARQALTIEFALHDDGPATRFATSAVVGDAFEVSGGSRPGFRSRAGSPWTVLFADQSALPAVAAILEQVPAGHPVHAWLEVPASSDVLQFETAASLQTHWLLESGGTNARLVEAGLALEIPDGDGEVWVGCEADAMRTIRRHLLGELAVPRDLVHTRAYWKKGVVAHSDHDTGEDNEGDR